MGLVHAYKKGEVPASKVSKAVKDAAKSMSKKSVKKYAKTKHDDLPRKVTREDLKKLVKTFGVKKVLEACQKGYMTHPTRKTKIMFGKRYRNCVKKEDTLPSPSRKLVKKMKKKLHNIVNLVKK